MKTIKERIKNSFRAYIIGDTLGVPYEFQTQGDFVCTKFSCGGFHYQSKGIWSDDTSILLCLIDALPKNDCCTAFEDNLKDWYHSIRFHAGTGLFDVGNQTANSIARGFPIEKTDRMGNGALFYSLPIACITLFEDDKETGVDFRLWSKLTHFNDNCFEYGTRLSCLLKKLLRTLSIENFEVEDYENRGDVINTYNLCLDNFYMKRNKSTSLFEDLCSVVNLGEDTDTNAAIFGSMMGCIKPVEEIHWNQVAKHEWIDGLIDNFVNYLIEMKCLV